MSPNSPESRLGRVEQDLARVRQRSEDHETDIRAFAPLVVDLATIKEKLIHAEATLDRLTAADTVRQKESKANRTLLWVAAIGLMGTFVSSTAVVISAVL